MISNIIIVILGISTFLSTFVGLPSWKIHNKVIVRIVLVVFVCLATYSIVRDITSNIQSQKDRKLLKEIDESIQNRFGDEFKEVIVALYDEKISTNEQIMSYGKSKEEYGIPLVDKEFYRQLPTTLLALNLIHTTAVVWEPDDRFVYVYDLTENGKKLGKKYKGEK